MAEVLRAAFSLALRFYHGFLSPFLPCACRFFPSCSLYMAQAIRKYGIFTGLSLGVRRLSRCHPRHPGGYDPVS